MGKEEYISVKKEAYDKLMREIDKAYVACNEMSLREMIGNVRTAAENLLDMEEEQDIEEMILNLLRETKSKDPDLNAKIYILHQDLRRERISKEEALEKLQQYQYISRYDKLVY